ncbi:MAG: 50S ribosomal protein L17 [Thermovirgaceae bacterium]|jgi:large subunit ribosomal protein L17|nr:MAG: 50S ribosomal protein L17 [Synergistales bacterium 57_84]KUK87729.1 MAG: 50S ribosomal protein L17 [Synergistales bacterium 58_81]MDD2517136.1 50S ribosomal protein L17 [Synergistales bacterium]MDI9392718.1 50S ribosomal protein L17 [Synergistota bacterium]NLV64578.1 50S ribosomal protein L17 [Synergistaceae bacterium]HRW87938.1 50S ribosomal protein L17 [Thermovirgaceae bacterium]
MRHRVDRRRLGRYGSHRLAMLSNLTASLFLEERVETTVTRAKEVRRFAERMITKAKIGDLHNRRIVASRMGNVEAVKKLFNDIAGRFSERQGGYTRIIKTGYRKGDAAPMAVIELVERS